MPRIWPRSMVARRWTTCESVTSTPHNRSEILLGVTGSVAAYKSAALCSALVQAGHGVSVAMTHAAERFVGRATFEALSMRPVVTDIWQPFEHFQGEHIGLAARADAYLIAPCSADMLGRLAGGLGGDPVSLLALTVECPLLVAPAMNRAMWQKPAVQRNVEQLQADGAQIVGPDDGWQSCRANGTGRMSDPAELQTAVEAALKSAISPCEGDRG